VNKCDECDEPLGENRACPLCQLWCRAHAAGKREGIEAAARESERALIEYSEIDILDTTPERLRIARRIRALLQIEEKKP
jgi:hypothetical protein